MLIEKNTLVRVGDGHHLRANIYRPEQDGRFPVLMSLGIYEAMTFTSPTVTSCSGTSC